MPETSTLYRHAIDRMGLKFDKEAGYFYELTAGPFPTRDYVIIRDILDDLEREFFDILENSSCTGPKIWLFSGHERLF